VSEKSIGCPMWILEGTQIGHYQMNTRSQQHRLSPENVYASVEVTDGAGQLVGENHELEGLHESVGLSEDNIVFISFRARGYGVPGIGARLHVAEADAMQKLLAKAVEIVRERTEVTGNGNA